MAKIRQSNLDNSIVTGLTELAEGAASTDVVLVYDASTGTLKKITQTNLLNFPTISSVSPTNALTGDGTGNHTFIITGTGFTGATPTLLTNGGSSVSFDSFVVDSATQITGTIAKSSMSDANEPYDVKVTAASGLVTTLANQISVDASPIFATAAGSLASIFDGARTGVSVTVEATDPESAGDVGYEIIGSLPAGLTSSVTSGILTISGTADAVGSNTTTNFSVKANDVASNVSTRAFSITVNAPTSQSFTSSGTFSVPSGVTAVDVLVVAGGGGTAPRHTGGGGGGGLIFMPEYPVTPSGTVSVTVGNGGSLGNPVGQPGQDSVFGTLTAKGGGGSGADAQSGSGGSGSGEPGPGGGVGSATQPTQPGNSGTYGFGNAGGSNSAGQKSGGGGGAGTVGGNSPQGPADKTGRGGSGRTYSISGAPVGYAGGGGGGGISGSTGGTASEGGGTGGCNQGGQGGVCGQANKGGGGGGGSDTGPTAGANGGKGVVIVRY